MSSPDQDDASPSPEYSGDHDEDMAAEQIQKDQKGDDGEKKDANGQTSKSNAKDPLRPRRKKARRACFACQRAHLTCGDERPCLRCIKRNLQDHCMDGVRKKAKYLHDAPDGALMPGVGGHYPYMNGNRPTPLPSQDTQAVSMAQQGNHYAQAPQQAYHPPNSAQPAQMQQFGGPLFDPSDPALFNFDISSLNFGNHYGALEFGMLGHMSSGAAETPPNDNGMINTQQPVNIYNPQVQGGYVDPSQQASMMPMNPNGLPTDDWQQPSSRNGSLQVQTPHGTPTTASIDHNGHRQDSLNGPHAFAIGQGPASHHTASPASTDANSTYEADNPMATAAFFANPHQPQPQRSPTMSRRQQESRPPNNALQPIHSNGIRKRQRDTKSIYQGIVKPHDYVKGYHKLFQLILTKYSRPWAAKAQEYVQNFRGVLVDVHSKLEKEDLIHQEKGLQRHLLTLQEHFAEVGTPFIICRRSGEIVGMNKEFTILTGWKREVLLGQEPNLTVNQHGNRDPNESEMSTQTNTTPTLAAQQAEGESEPQPVNIIQLMEPKSALQYLQRFSELAYQDPRGFAHQRVNMLRYQTKADVERLAERAGRDEKEVIKSEGGGVHQGESAMQRLGAKNGMVDCMIWWHIKRDIFDMPVLVCMSVMPVLDKGLH
ncbi:Transcriptional regulator of nonfermentable carbon utilization [Nothophoma quercina]|uniref:Transcriptional regulator of nonfermentable carbon utilization n=1 Tax=Nothophoma quercina TaxID=749835 RepID=A0ABR3QXK6_9PLEO